MFVGLVTTKFQIQLPVRPAYSPYWLSQSTMINLSFTWGPLPTRVIISKFDPLMGAAYHGLRADQL